VDLFFVLSGYLIGGQLLATLAREKSIRLWSFFAPRGLRVLAGFVVALGGVLMCGHLLATLAREKSIRLGSFFARRVLRIMPAYFVILAVYFLLPSWREYPDMSQPLWKFLLSVQNIARHGGTAFSHAWSLAVEDQFYLALPFILLFLFRRLD